MHLSESFWWFSWKTVSIDLENFDVEVIERIVDTSNNAIYINLTNRENDIINNNDNDRDWIKLFPITVGGSAHNICSATTII